LVSLLRRAKKCGVLLIIYAAKMPIMPVNVYPEYQGSSVDKPFVPRNTIRLF
jgi:hypothetical protein